MSASSDVTGSLSEVDLGLLRSGFSTGTAARSAFDHLLAHAQAASFRLIGRTAGTVRAVEFQSSELRRNPFSAQVASRHVNFYLRRAVLDAHPTLFDAASRRFGRVPDNRLLEYRVRIHDPAEAATVLNFLRRHGAWPNDQESRRFVSATFAPITAEHLLAAARRLSSGFAAHPFGESTTYDVVFGKHRLAPKAVFGLAAEAALGFPVLPENFRGGEATTTFRMLRENGYRIEPKSGIGTADMEDLSEEDRVWSEGRPRLVTHLKRERGSGLATAKRARFRAEHGRLRCERCGMDPMAVFGEEVGDACIEVHHSRTCIADMGEGRETSLDDLQCLCANCHRVTHFEMKLAADEERRVP